MAKRLGKGLNAIIPEFPEGMDLINQVAEIDIAKIKINPHQPRKAFDPHRMEELKQSIREKGIIQPITVRQLEEGFELIAGERRIRACKELQMKRIPAYVLPVSSEVEMVEMALVENVQREDLNPVEEAEAYYILANTFDLSHEEIAQKVSKDRTTITNSLRLLNLPQDILTDLRRVRLSAGHARPLLSISDPQEQINLWRRIRRDGLSVRTVEQLVKKIGSDKTKVRPPKKTGASRWHKNMEEVMMHKMGTRVRISGKDKGRIEIDFYTRDDLQRIIELIESISDERS